MMDGVRSPLFPDLALSSETSIKLPPKPLAHSGSVLLYLILAEKTLFIQGFEENEYKERPPLLLRGSLFLRITKPVKIKLINLKFSGTAKTDWPEGIPPKKTEFQEVQQLIQHNWPFFNSNSSIGDANKGANIFKPLNGAGNDEISNFSLDPQITTRESSTSIASVLRRAKSPSPARSRSGTTSSGIFSHLAATTSNILESTTSNDLLSIKSSDTSSLESNKTFAPGDYIYNFELPIPASTPESMNVTFGTVNYYLEASVERSGAFKTSLQAREEIFVVRTPLDSSLEENEPIAIIRDWEDKLKYEIVIASKAVVLNTYLPLAFKLTPLDKVQLHRIRVYLTENLEYYCRHKKIHRLEPTRKYLLLQHKPNDGLVSLLGDDEITSRELEFQVYIPEKLSDKQKLHPDTSYTNIQSHHWIKICLRLSKLDPTLENPDKRKHYEISIDSPIHVLSPLATHANTLLPSYVQTATMSPVPFDYMENPPLSPNVIPVDNSLDAMMSPPLSTPIDQYHVPPDMHLDSNLYKPENMAPELKSPQAQPFSPIISPEMAALSPNLQAFNSPNLHPINSRPIHLLRRPSVNPPPFDADAPPPTFDDEPPLYQENDSNPPENNAAEEDIGEYFQFTGLSPYLPSSIIRATSPSPASRSRDQFKLNDSNTNLASSPLASVRSDTVASAIPMTASSLLQSIENEDPITGSQNDSHKRSSSPLNSEPMTVSDFIVKPSSSLATPPVTAEPPLSPNAHLEGEALSPISSVNSSHSRSSQSTQFDPIGEPLLNALTSTSTVDQARFVDRDRFQSIDITSMYSNSNNTNVSLQSNIANQRTESIWHPLESDFTNINHPHLISNSRRPVFNKKYGPPIEPNSISMTESQRLMSFGVEQMLANLPESDSISTLTPQVSTPTLSSQLGETKPQPPSVPAPRNARSQRSSSSATNSLNSNNSSLTLKSAESTSIEPQPMSNLEIKKISNTSASRPTFGQDTAF